MPAMNTCWPQNMLALLLLLLQALLPPASPQDAHTAAVAAAAAPRGITLHLQRKERYAVRSLGGDSPHRRRAQQAQHEETGATSAVSGGVTAGMYMASVAIGTPPREFQLQLDTGSATLAVPGVSCSACARGYATTDDETGLVHLHDLLQFYDAETSSTGTFIGCHSDDCGRGGCAASRSEAGAYQCGSAHSLGTCFARDGCEDQEAWFSAEEGFSFVTCEYIASLDPGCVNYHDYGQKTHCLDTCQRCQDCCTDGACYFGVQYLDGSGIQGKLARDIVRIGQDWLPTTTSFGVYEEFDLQRGATSPHWKRAPADGIWGLGPSERNCKPTCQPSVLDSLSDTHNLESIFALCVNDGASAAAAQSLDVGRIDQRKVDGDLHFVPCVEETDYIISGPRSTRIGGASAGATTEDWGRILVDSGSSNCVFSDAVFGNLAQVAARESPAHAALWLSSTRCMTVSTCQFDLDLLPQLEFDFVDEQSVEFTVALHPREYTVWKSGEDLCLNIRPMSSIGSSHAGSLRYGSIFGDNFFSRRYVAFDRTHTQSAVNRIGLSIAGDCNAGVHDRSGCMDPQASNFAASADHDDGTCIYDAEECPVLLISSDAACAEYLTGVYRVSAETPIIDGHVHYVSISGAYHLYWSASHSSWFIDPDTEPCTYWALSRTRSTSPGSSWLVYCQSAEQFVELDLDIDPCSDTFGCTDPSARNFAVNSQLDDGRCDYDQSCTVTATGGCQRSYFNGVYSRSASINGRVHFHRSQGTNALHIYYYTSTAGWSRWLVDSDLSPDGYLGYVDSTSEFPPRTGWSLYCVDGSSSFDESQDAALSYCGTPSPPPPPPPTPPPPTRTRAPPPPPPPSPPPSAGTCASVVLTGGCRLGSLQGTYTRVPNSLQSGQPVYRKGALSRWVYYDGGNQRWLVDQDLDPDAAFALGSAAASSVPPNAGWLQYCGSGGYDESTLRVLCQ